MNNQLPIFTTLLSSIKDYGIFNIMKAFMLMVMFSFVVRVMVNPNFLFRAYKEFIATEHVIEMTERERNDLEVNKRLPVYLYKYHADRVFVVQYHNGVSDWRYGSMRFEEHTSEVKALKYDHSGVHLSWLRLPNYLRSNTLFIGDIEQFRSIDATLYDSFSKAGTKYIAVINLTDSAGDAIGIFGICWNKEINLDEFRTKIEKYLYEDRGVLQNYVQPQIINASIK